jgi:hypothetical protein
VIWPAGVETFMLLVLGLSYLIAAGNPVLLAWQLIEARHV